MKNYGLIFLLLLTPLSSYGTKKKKNPPKELAATATPAIVVDSESNPMITTAHICAGIKATNSFPTIIGNVHFTKYCSGCNTLKPSDCSACDKISAATLATQLLKTVDGLTNIKYQFSQSCPEHINAYYCSACR